MVRENLEMTSFQEKMEMPDGSVDIKEFTVKCAVSGLCCVESFREKS